jgi:tetratricopeptide (TPR) repeat protein
MIKLIKNAAAVFLFFPIAASVSVSFAAIFPHAQNQDRDQGQRWRLAQDYERNGAIDRAAEIYVKLFFDDPRHQGYYQGAFRTLTQLHRFDELIPLIERRIAVSGDVNARADLGKAYYRKGDDARARTIWNELLSARPQPGAYSVVGAAMIENGLLGEAVQVYLQGRRALNQPQAFIFELANIYTARKEYETAVEEYLNYLEMNSRQLPFIQGKISELLAAEDPPQASRIAAALTAALPKFKSPILIHRLSAVVYLHAKDFSNALDAYKTIERLQTGGAGEPATPGAELYNFAERAREANALDAAEAAFQIIVTEMPSSPYFLPAQFGLAEVLKQRGRHEAALSAFQKVKARQPNSPWAVRAWFAEGEIYFAGKMFDKAAAAYSTVYEKYGNEPERIEAIFRLGDSALAMNDFARAAEWYGRADQSGSSSVRDKVTYRLAMLEFYQGRFRAAQKLFDGITGPTAFAPLNERNESMVNDALEMQLLIDAHLADSSRALLSFARAELAVVQGRVSAAVDTLKNLMMIFSGSSITPLALFTLAQRYAEIGDYLESLNVYQRLLKDHPKDMRADRALMRIAEIYENNLKDFVQAQQTYERILSDYPKSLFLDDARQKIRSLSEKPAPVVN